ncbi:methyltransferase domain-containing protein [Streptomyces kunmingensis]|uniref:Methyltransferase domain-containing protein n=1 Tax=Streptomyces kunmingensis TaxID=68225 RepID=A0ABU6CI68_9ACTN|nr:methyltransferase [Streptomyces kunmingensis]MEB3964387.1 methyltransferase domain-containing protein [Streptomyces kunmingensis]
MTHHVSAGHHGSHADTRSHSHGSDPGDDLAQILDLDAELFAPYLAATTRRIADLSKGGVRHIVDLGAGTGAGTFALLERFPDARVTAVDSSAAMLEQLTRAAAAKDVAARVRPLQADAGASLPGIGDADLVWASASLHHLDDPAAALAAVFAALRPGGLLAVAELDGMPRFLPDDAVPDRVGLEARCRAALAGLHAEQVPHLGSDWAAALTGAGFAIEHERTEELRVDADTPLPESAGRYAYLTLRRIREAVDGLVDAADLVAFDALLDGGAQDVRHRADLVVRSTRELYIARRP